MHKLDLIESEHERRHLAHVDETRARRLQHDHAAEGRAVEAEVAERLLERDLVVRQRLDLLDERLEGHVELASHLALALLGDEVVAVAALVVLAQVGDELAHLGVELQVEVLLLAEHDGVLEVKVKQDDDLVVARLEDGALDVVVEHFDLVAAQRRVEEAVGVRLERVGRALLHDVGSQVEVLEFGIDLVVGQYERVLLDHALFLLLLVLLLLVLLLHVLDVLEGQAEVGRRRRDLARLFDVGRTIRDLLDVDAVLVGIGALGGRGALARLGDRGARVEEVQAQVGVVALDGRAQILERRDVKRRRHAVYGQYDRFVALVHVDLELLDLALLVGQLRRIAIGRHGLAHLLLGRHALLVQDAVFGLLVQALDELLLMRLALLLGCVVRLEFDNNRKLQL